MNRFGFILVAAFLFALTPATVSAHVLKTDGTMGGVVHIQPDDDPVVGQISEVYIELKDTSGAFVASNCDCRVLISNRTEELYTQSLPVLEAAEGALSSSFSYTFPQPDMYVMTIIGKAKDGGFKDFRLTYEFRVDNVSANNTLDQPNETSSVNIPYFQFGLLLIILVVFIVIFFYKRKRL